jgi:hypothetical protein
MDEKIPVSSLGVDFKTSISGVSQCVHIYDPKVRFFEQLSQNRRSNESAATRYDNRLRDASVKVRHICHKKNLLRN